METQIKGHYLVFDDGCICIDDISILYKTKIITKSGYEFMITKEVHDELHNHISSKYSKHE